MKFLIFVPILFLLSCGPRVICSRLDATDCHTRAEWDKINEKNWQMVDCMHRELHRPWGDNERDPRKAKAVTKALKKCNAYTLLKIYN